jgi:hypothetical protein
MRNAQNAIERWKKATEALGLKIPEERIAQAAPIYDALWTATRPALQRDLSLVEPDFQFRPDGE